MAGVDRIVVVDHWWWHVSLEGVYINDMTNIIFSCLIHVSVKDTSLKKKRVRVPLSYVSKFIFGINFAINLNHENIISTNIFFWGIISTNI